MLFDVFKLDELFIDVDFGADTNEYDSENICVFEDSEAEAPWDEEAAQLEEDEFNEENSIMLRDPDDRSQVEAEIRELESAVPRILRDYRLLDRLGEGE